MYQPEPRQFSPEDVKLLEGIARQTTVAIENARLHSEVQRKEEIRGELLQDIFAIQEEERKRIARELHDETSQVVASLNASLEAAVFLLPADIAKAKSMVEKAQALSVNILDDVHKLIYELRPSVLDDMGLVAAARWLAEEKLEAVGIAVKFKTVGRQKRIEPRIEVTLYRVIQEAVNNIARHSGAKNAGITLHLKKNSITVLIKDDGRGFDVNEAISSKERPRGLGLEGMKERVAIVKGSLEINSDRSGGGTEITIEIPLGKEASNAKN
jgi:signal transduction histidine kinase